MVKVLSVNGKIPLVDGKAIKALDNIAMRVEGGYIQYSTDNGKTWVNLIAEADLKGDKGDPGTPGKDGHSPVVTATKSGKTTTISVDGTAIATVEDGTDGAPGTPGTPGKDGTDGHTPVKGVDYFTEADKNEIAEDAASKVNLSSYRTAAAQDIIDSGKQDKITSTNKLAYSLISGTPTIPTVPTNVSAFTNDSGYLTLATLPKYEGVVE